MVLNCGSQSQVHHPQSSRKIKNPARPKPQFKTMRIVYPNRTVETYLLTFSSKKPKVDSFCAGSNIKNSPNLLKSQENEVKEEKNR